jgi:hypothetical protein
MILLQNHTVKEDCYHTVSIQAIPKTMIVYLCLLHQVQGTESLHKEDLARWQLEGTTICKDFNSIFLALAIIVMNKNLTLSLQT